MGIKRTLRDHRRRVYAQSIHALVLWRSSSSEGTICVWRPEASEVNIRRQHLLATFHHLRLLEAIDICFHNLGRRFQISSFHRQYGLIASRAFQSIKSKDAPTFPQLK
jgi:hypothetical protein